MSLALPQPTFAAEEQAPHPDDLQILQKIARHEGLDAPRVTNPTGWPQLRGVQTIRFTATERPRHALTAGYDENGRVTHLVGNGPLLSNEAFGWIAALPELRVVRIDHNIPHSGSDVPHDQYDGSGLAALENSKLEDVRLTGAFADAGMKHLARIRSLRSIDIFHTRVTDEGIAHLANHPRIEEVRFGPMGVPKITNKTLKTLATLPRIKRIGMDETFLTYDDGFEHLKPLRGRLESVGLKQSLVLPSDVEKLKADHPGLEVETSTPAEIAQNRYLTNQLLKWASPEAGEYLKTGVTP
ncbi:MAG: hypothetical protein EA381_16675 [Planctomycetaceae bacterium]|nr:MAG: hypothetical protein EA381_16675 [Planctomycetaceae bacterium]